MMEARFSPKVLHVFAETLSSSLGSDTLSAVFAKAGLPAEWANPACFKGLDEKQTATAYSKLQAALRTYYGRGARGTLIRIGGRLWERLLNDANITLKTQAAFVRGMPIGLRRKFALDILARLISMDKGDLTVHTLDLDLLCVDHVSPSTLGQCSTEPICYVTHGMIRECLYWSMGYEHDIEEISCRSLGAKQCEFKITVGGG